MTTSTGLWAARGVGFASLLCACAFVACDPTNDPLDDTAAGPGSGAAGGAGPASSGQGGLSVGSGGAGTMCNTTPTSDTDKDGYTIDEGDCDDCDPAANPGAVEVIAVAREGMEPPEPADEDCDSLIDNVPEPCDTGLALDDDDPVHAANALEVCEYIIKASWVLADGSPPPVDPMDATNFHLGHGILPDLGQNVLVQRGDVMLMVSSGTARRETDPGFVHRTFDKGYTCNPPFGFPKESASCPNVTTGPCTDSTGLEIELKAPTNAEGITFDFNFFTYEWPEYICTKFNDFFVANLVLQGNKFPDMQMDGNVSFDMMQNPISVNNAFLDVCDCPNGPPCDVPPGMPVKQFDCAGGSMGVEGTDFDQDDVNGVGWTNGSTGWLRTGATVEPGKTFKLRFVTYDSDDHNVDSSTLIDNFVWLGVPAKGTKKIE